MCTTGFRLLPGGIKVMPAWQVRRLCARGEESCYGKLVYRRPDCATQDQRYFWARVAGRSPPMLSWYSRLERRLELCSGVFHLLASADDAEVLVRYLQPHILVRYLQPHTCYRYIVVPVEAAVIGMGRHALGSDNPVTLRRALCAVAIKDLRSDEEMDAVWTQSTMAGR